MYKKESELKDWHVWVGMIAVLVILATSSYFVYGDGINTTLRQIGAFINAFLVSAALIGLGAAFAEASHDSTSKRSFFIALIVTAAIAAFLLMQMNHMHFDPNSML